MDAVDIHSSKGAGQGTKNWKKGHHCGIAQGKRQVNITVIGK